MLYFIFPNIHACSKDTITNDASTLDLLDAERTFITLGLESDEPEIDFPWRFRNGNGL